jgi:hypothetical protein
MTEMTTAQALLETLSLPNITYGMPEYSNVVEGLFAIARSLDRIAKVLETAIEEQDDDQSTIPGLQPAGKEADQS